jgi:hypothetical protein
MQNGATDVFISVLLLAGSDLAETMWEKGFVTWLAGHDQSIFGLGVVGFDIGEIAWDPDRFAEQKAFVLAVIDTSLRRYRWEILDYDPPYVHLDLATFRILVEKFSPYQIMAMKPAVPLAYINLNPT